MRPWQRNQKLKSTLPAPLPLNKRAKFEYHLDQRIEAGLVLTGWEIKSIRDGRANLIDSYVVMKAGEAFLVGAHISPLMTACTHVVAEPRRERKAFVK